MKCSSNKKVSKKLGKHQITRLIVIAVFLQNKIYFKSLETMPVVKSKKRHLCHGII